MSTTYQSSPAYHKRWRLDRELGRTRTRPATEVRAHINTLLAAHLSYRGIADLSEVSASTVHGIATGRQSTVHHDVARRILAVDVGRVYERPNRAGFVPNIGARRRIEALLAIGWRHQDITAAMGTRTTSPLVLHQVGGWVARETHDAACAAYAALSMQPGPSDNTRTRAARLGYAPPLAWDDDDLDDPYAEPPAGWQSCAHPDCAAEPDAARGLCWTHYQQRRHAS